MELSWCGGGGRGPPVDGTHLVRGERPRRHLQLLSCSPPGEEGGDVGELIAAREEEEVNVVAAQREEGVGVSQAVLLSFLLVRFAN